MPVAGIGIRADRVGHGQANSLIRPGEHGLHGLPRRVLACIAQRLLERALESGGLVRTQFARRSGRGQLNAAPERAVGGEEVGDRVVEGGGACVGARLSIRIAKRADGSPGLPKSVGGERAGGGQPGTRSTEIARLEQGFNGIELDDETAQTVGEDVVDVSGDALALGEQFDLCPLFAHRQLAFAQQGRLGLRLAELAAADAGENGDDDAAGHPEQNEGGGAERDRSERHEHDTDDRDPQPDQDRTRRVGDHQHDPDDDWHDRDAVGGGGDDRPGEGHHHRERQSDSGRHRAEREDQAQQPGGERCEGEHEHPGRPPRRIRGQDRIADDGDAEQVEPEAQPARLPQRIRHETIMLRQRASDRDGRRTRRFERHGSRRPAAR